MLDGVQVLSLPAPEVAPNRMGRSRGPSVDGPGGLRSIMLRTVPAAQITMRYAVRHQHACSVACCGRTSRSIAQQGAYQRTSVLVRRQCTCRMTTSGAIECLSVCVSAYDSFQCT